VTDPVQLRADIPHDAAQIIGQIIGKMSMTGLTGHEAAALFQAVSTVIKALEPAEKPAE
jgi:hypothetical protein